MDSSEISWFSEMELGLEESVFGDPCDFLGSLDDEVAAILGGGEATHFETNSCFSFENNNNNLHSFPTTNNLMDNPITNNDFPAPDPNNAPIILKFGNPREDNKELSPEDLKQVVKKTRRARPASQTYDHIVAERKRREQLSQRFIILSTMVPGLKRMDKTSVLDDAIKYMKRLQEKVETLEEQAKNQTMEPVVLVRKSQIVADDEKSSGGGGSSSELPLPEIEASVCNDGGLITIRIQCEKKRGVLVNLLSKMEKLHLVVVNSNVVTFAGFVLDITIFAKMEDEFKLTAKEAVKQLRASLTS